MTELEIWNHWLKRLPTYFEKYSSVELGFLKEIMLKQNTNIQFNKVVVGYPPSFSEQQKQLAKKTAIYALSGRKSFAQLISKHCRIPDFLPICNHSLWP